MGVVCLYIPEAYPGGLWGPGAPGTTKGAPNLRRKREGKGKESEKKKKRKKGKKRKDFETLFTFRTLRA